MENGLLSKLMYALTRSKNGQIQEMPSLADIQRQAQLAQMEGVAPSQMPQEAPMQGLLSGALLQGVPVDQTTFSGNKKFKAK